MLGDIFDQKVNIEVNIKIFPCVLQRADYVILSSGLGGHGQFWQPQIADLQEHFHVLVYDQEGCHPNSRLLPADYAIEDLAQQVFKILKQYKIKQFHFIGHALGGFIGAELACLCQETAYTMRSLTILNGWAQLDPHTRKCFEARIHLLKAAGAEAYVKAQALFLYPPAWISTHIETIQQQEHWQLQHFPPHENVLKRLHALMLYQFSPDVQYTLQNMAIHLLANQDDFLVPVGCSRHLKQLLPNAQLTVLPYGAHAATVTQSTGMNKEILNFLNIQKNKVQHLIV